MGNQAALSSLSGVPQGCLFGADVAVTVCKDIFEGLVYGSIRYTKYVSTRVADYCRRVLLFLLEALDV